MENNADGFLIQGESLGRIGRVTREVETNKGIGPPEQRRKRGLISILEGVFTEDLAACADPEVPTTAKFQIKTLVKADNSWKNEDSPSIVPVLNRTTSAWAEGDIATIEELYPDKYFVRGSGSPGGFIKFRPLDVAPGIGSTCVAVEAEVVSAECGSNVQPGDIVIVWDTTQRSSYFGLPAELLFASTGGAHLMNVSDAERYELGEDIDPGVCRYVVNFMDCSEEI